MPWWRKPEATEPRDFPVSVFQRLRSCSSLGPRRGGRNFSDEQANLISSRWYWFYKHTWCRSYWVTRLADLFYSTHGESCQWRWNPLESLHSTLCFSTKTVSLRCEALELFRPEWRWPKETLGALLVWSEYCNDGFKEIGISLESDAENKESQKPWG